MINFVNSVSFHIHRGAEFSRSISRILNWCKEFLSNGFAFTWSKRQCL